MVPLPRRGRKLALFLAFIAAPALGQPAPVTSAGPDKVAVTFYRDPGRGEDAIDREAPGSIALIVETRTVDLPPGEATVRFEGVAGGIVPKSAILFGAPQRERNREAALLSQKGLLDAFTGQAVTLRRTDPATGKVSEERATIRSANDSVVVTTRQGVEALQCTGLSETLLYPGVPSGLSAKPVLTMTTRDQPGGRATITLAYLATGFDWDATYVATLGDDGKSMGLLAWLTMASADETTFPDATLSAVAGQINRSDETRDDTRTALREAAEDFSAWSQCWPSGTTTSGLGTNVPPPMVPPPAPMMMAMDASEIVVTGAMRREKVMDVPLAVTATSEALGDLKLYRVPEPITVAARSQKQVAFLAADRVKGELVYRSVAWDEPEDPEMLFRFRNRKADGLGDPLPAGKVAVFQDSKFGRQLVGEANLADKATDEEVEIVFGEPTGVTLETDDEPDARRRWTTITATIRNANPFPVRYEIEFPTGNGKVYRGVPGKLVNKPGKKVWATTLEPGSENRLTYRVADEGRD